MSEEEILKHITGRMEELQDKGIIDEITRLHLTEGLKQNGIEWLKEEIIRVEEDALRDAT